MGRGPGRAGLGPLPWCSQRCWTGGRAGQVPEQDDDTTCVLCFHFLVCSPCHLFFERPSDSFQASVFCPILWIWNKGWVGRM